MLNLQCLKLDDVGKRAGLVSYRDRCKREVAGWSKRWAGLRSA